MAEELQPQEEKKQSTPPSDEVDGLDIGDDEITHGEIKTKSNIAVEIFEFLEMLILASCVIMLFFTFVARICTVDGPSMNRTLEHGDKLIVSDLFYTPSQGDIVVFQDLETINPLTGKPYENAIIKRVIATGGQTVILHYEMIEGVNIVTITVDGKVLNEPYRYYDVSSVDFRYSGEVVYEVPENALFVMGDNTYHSEDSRGVFEYVETDKVLGRAVFRLGGNDISTIFSKFGFVH